MKHAAGLVTVLFLASATLAAGPIDAPTSTEPRVEVGTGKSLVGFVSSEGVGKAFSRVHEGDALHSRDVLVALPGFRVNVQPTSKNVNLLLWGNMPELTSSPALESAVILHDTRAYDLDFTLLRGRVVLTNTREKGAAKIWLATGLNAVEFTLNEPGSQVVLEINGRWPTGVGFHRHRKAGDDPTQLWEVYVLKGDVQIKSGKTTWAMAAAPGRAYFHGDSVHGPYAGGPQPVEKVPDWADLEAKPGPGGLLMAKVIEEYAGKLKGDDAGTVAMEFFKLSMKDKVAERGSMVRKLVVTTLAALDNVERVVDLLEHSPNDDVRKAAVIGLRHWIGRDGGRDDKLYDILVDHRHYSKVEADAVMQLLHSPFDPDVAETYDTLIAFLRHRKQAVRELAHWHLVRLAPGGSKIPFDASASAEERNKAAEAWRKLELPPKKG